jgi:hypothetical protein
MATDRGRTRRELVLSAAARAADDDAQRLRRLLDFERLAVDVYAAALGSRRLTPATARLAAELHGQEQRHADALAAHLRIGARRERRRTAAELQEALGREGIRVRFAGLRDEHAWLGLLTSIENALEGAYYLAAKHVRGTAASVLVATILASEAQHASALSELQHAGRPELAAPSALVEGSAAPPNP